MLVLKNIDLDKINVSSSFMDSLRNAETEQDALKIFKKRFEQRKAWFEKQNIDYKIDIIAVFRNNGYWNVVAVEKIRDFQSVKLFYSKNGFLQKRNLTEEELNILKEQMKKATDKK